MARSRQVVPRWRWKWYSLTARPTADAAFITPIGPRHSQPAARVHAVKLGSALEPAAGASPEWRLAGNGPRGGDAWCGRLTGIERERASTLQVDSPKS